MNGQPGVMLSQFGDEVKKFEYFKDEYEKFRSGIDPRTDAPIDPNGDNSELLAYIDSIVNEIKSSRKTARQFGEQLVKNGTLQRENIPNFHVEGIEDEVPPPIIKTGQPPIMKAGQPPIIKADPGEARLRPSDRAELDNYVVNYRGNDNPIIPISPIPYNNPFNRKTMQPYNRNEAHAKFNWEDIAKKDNRQKEIRQKYEYRPLNDNQQKMLDQLIDITINKKKTIDFNPKLMNEEYAKKFAEENDGWAEWIDVNPYDNRDEKELVVFNKYSQPQYINGFHYTQNDAGVQGLYQKTYPNGYDDDRRIRVPYSQFKKEAFQYDKRVTPWDRILVHDPHPQVYEDLRGRGYKVPSPPKRSLAQNQIWNKVVSVSIKNWMKKWYESKDHLKDRDALLFIRSYMNLLKFINILYIYYVDSRFIALIKKSPIYNNVENKMKKWKDYKKLCNKSSGLVNKKQFRRMFFAIFVDPPNQFWWSEENTRRAFMEADIHPQLGSIIEFAKALMVKYQTELARIDEIDDTLHQAKQPFIENPPDTFQLPQQKAYLKKKIKDEFNKHLDKMKEALQQNVLDGLYGEWNDGSLSNRPGKEFGNLDFFNEPLKDEKYTYKKPDPKNKGKFLFYNIAEFPNKNDDY